MNKFKLLPTYKEKYTKYNTFIEGNIQKLNSSELKEMKILETLVNLGLDIKHPGTHSIKELSISALQDLSNKEDISQELQKLIKEFQNPRSKYYVEHAKFDLEIGLNTYNEMLKECVENSRKTVLNKVENVIDEESPYLNQVSSIISFVINENIKQAQKIKKIQQ